LSSDVNQAGKDELHANPVRHEAWLSANQAGKDELHANPVLG
jgi:hypothetical protein